jgi:hypothetical protein
MNVNSSVRSLFKSKVMKFGKLNTVFSGCAALLRSWMRPNVPLYPANDPVDAETAKSPAPAGGEVQAESPGWLHCQLKLIAPIWKSPVMWSWLPSIKDARATVGAHAAMQHINVRLTIPDLFTLCLPVILIEDDAT